VIASLRRVFLGLDDARYLRAVAPSVDQRLASTVGPLRREFRLHREGNAQSLTCHWSVSDILPVDDIACGAERCESRKAA
jgi:hypothetical protein